MISVSKLKYKRNTGNRRLLSRIYTFFFIFIYLWQVRSVDAKEALRLQKENNFVILDVRPVAEYKEVSPGHKNYLLNLIFLSEKPKLNCSMTKTSETQTNPIYFGVLGSSSRGNQCTNIQAYKRVDSVGHSSTSRVRVLRNLCRNGRESRVPGKYGS